MSRASHKPASGMPPHEPTRANRELVTLHTMVGTTQETIADIIEIDPKTLRKYYRKELDQSKAKANATIGGALFNKAKSGDTAAMIFWMKTQAGWRETLNVTGSISTAQMTQEECEAFALKRMEEIRAAREDKESK